jgi:hypothetical protein
LTATGNAFTKAQFMEFPGYEEFAERRTKLKNKDLDVASAMSGMDLCGLID